MDLNICGSSQIGLHVSAAMHGFWRLKYAESCKDVLLGIKNKNDLLTTI